MSPTLHARQFFLAGACFLLGAIVFATVYAQAPLYYSNQNQYFLHGLADADVGLLREDWLANTRDPTPLFSALVAFTVRHLRPGAFFVYHALLLGAYGAAMLGLFQTVAGPAIASRRWPIFVVLFLACHSALARWCSYRWLGQDYPWFLQAGVAGQYVLGSMLQPSVFGALLVGAVCLFVRGRPFLAATVAVLGASVHSTYLLSAGMLTLGFLLALVYEGRSHQAVLVGAWALALVLPVTTYVLLNFAPTSAEQFADAERVLVNVRIPHHARLDRWLDPVAGAQIVGMALAPALARPARLRIVLAVPLLLGALLTLAQVATGSDALALLFPWRISAVLVPIATTVFLARFVSIPTLPLDGMTAWALALIGTLLLVVGGAWIGANRLAFHTNDEELAVMDWVRAHKAPGDVYLLPVRVPDLVANTRGSLSSDFKPLPDKRSDKRVIPIDLQRFRLHAEAPIYVDFKSVPYKDVEVLEWRERLRVAEQLRKQLGRGAAPEALAELRRLKITHVVRPAQQPAESAGLEPVYADDAYRVYRVVGQVSNFPDKAD